jgi:hypothetical protein
MTDFTRPVDNSQRSVLYCSVLWSVSGPPESHFAGEPGPDNRRREVTTGAETGSTEYRCAPKDRHLTAGISARAGRIRPLRSGGGCVVRARVGCLGLFSSQAGASLLPCHNLEEES